jgi:predicted short-subunit dehydrogenase-like oxidoreductase (DUF2520 family)
VNETAYALEFNTSSELEVFYFISKGGEKLKIGFIGAGKVGFSLGKYFSINSLKLSGYYSKNLDSSKKAAEFTYSSYYINIYDLIEESNIIFITTPDDVVSSIWQNIKSLKLESKIICHTSGSLSSKIFSDINNSGAFGYSIHPMFPFSDKFTTYKNLKNTYFSLEGHPKHLNTIKVLIESLGNKVFLINEDKKSSYHLANVMVSNFVLSLIHKGCTYLIDSGINENEALNCLIPLIENNILNLKQTGFLHSLTGPIERADLSTLKHHIEAISKKDLYLYENLSFNLLELSKEKHINRNYSEIENFLEGLKHEDFS